ncbi:MAG: methylenetetrahydrofolate--tRNA-(uracil(54)-C(5))-methyltransferase (FADH(2)-oxidizing) TrmFO [Chloroflexota bacterium]
MAASVNVIGGGLAGSEAAWQLAQRGYAVKLYEMRPVRQTGAHATNKLGELVCSNSLGSKMADRASGVLQNEIRMMGSMMLDAAEASAVPAGGALAVDRELFADMVTEKLEQHPNIEIIREEVTRIPDEPTIIATGPLTADSLAQKIAALSGQEYLYFYDALAPIVTFESIDMNVAFFANRYGHGDVEGEDGDYINCPLNRDEYEAFVNALLEAEKKELRNFEAEDLQFFERCMPIEYIAARGFESLAFGPMRPVGLRDPRTGKRPHAVVQLRRDNIAGSLYNLVGFQTNIRYGQQKDVLRLIPGLENAEFIRFGQMHRNTFINSPTLLEPSMQFRGRQDLYFAGQITGVEGYVGNIATGLLAAVNIARHLESKPTWAPPRETMLGAMCYYVTHAEAKHFQPMKANFGILPDLPQRIKNKRERYQAYAARALDAMQAALAQLDLPEAVAETPQQL